MTQWDSDMAALRLKASLKVVESKVHLVRVSMPWVWVWLVQRMGR